MRDLQEQDTMERMHIVVWRFRKQFHKYFLTPSPLQAAWFAEEELGEARRAAIRLGGPAWNRNNQESTTEADMVMELAQALIMVLSIDPDRIPKFVQTQKGISFATEMVACASQLIATDSMPQLREAYIDKAASALLLTIDELSSPLAAVCKAMRAIYVKRVRPAYALDLLEEIQLQTTDHNTYRIASQIKHLEFADDVPLLREK